MAEFLQNFQIRGQGTWEGPTKVFAAQSQCTFRDPRARRQWISRGLAISAHEHALVEHAFEATQCTGLVQSAFVATHAGTSARGCKWTATFFGFVSEAIARNLCDVVFAHAGIVLSKPCLHITPKDAICACSATHPHSSHPVEVLRRNGQSFRGWSSHFVPESGCPPFCQTSA